MNRYATKLVLAVLLVGTSTAVSLAGQFTRLGPAVTLEQLLTDGASVRAGDKLFTNFSYTPAGTVPWPATSEITVEPVLLNGQYGLHFVSGWTAFGSQVADAALSYQVSADAPNQITGMTLWASSADTSGTGQFSIVENVFGEVPGQALTDPLLVYADASGKHLLATASFDPTTSLAFAFKNIVVEGGGSGSAVLSEFFQTFSQVPEPTSLAMLLAGGLAVLRPRRQGR